MRPISKLTRIKVLLADGMGYSLKDKDVKKAFKLIKEFSILTFRYSLNTSRYHDNVSCWLDILITPKCSIHLSGGGSVEFSLSSNKEGATALRFRITPKVKIDKLIKLITEGIDYCFGVRKYIFNYLRNNKSLGDVKNFMVLKTFGGAKQ